MTRGALLVVAVSCVAACGGPAGAPDADAHAVRDMVEVPGGSVDFGGLTVDVAPFRIDRHEVTNDEFAAFVDATGYVTDAERIGDSVVFFHDFAERGGDPFQLVEGADWRHPSGPGSDLAGRGDHPVVNVSWSDARAFAAWAGARLPTAHEWILAARGGLAAPIYPWGDELRPDGAHMMNAWQGEFPGSDAALDGYAGTAPVMSFPPNGLGAHDLAGNVWEWTDSVAAEEGSGEARAAVTLGGSYLCRERAAEGFHACRAYRIGVSELKPVEDGNNHVGFRCARDVEGR